MTHLHSHTADRHAPQPPATAGRLIRWAKGYDSLVGVMLLGRRAQLRQETVALAGVQPGERVLEVGCGTGDVALAAAEQAGAAGLVAGIDPSPEMLAVARRKAQQRGAAIDFQLGVIEALPFPDHSFDVVLSSLMMHHLPGLLKRDGLLEIARILRPGGRLLIVDLKRPRGLLDRSLTALMMHRHLSVGAEELVPLARAAGFAEIESGPTSFRLLGFVRASTPAAGSAESRR